ncbi:uncharacterized protein LOC129884228 [Solanum dulcamara]|uniref:uncharacterized protein LOC129884228 n=1 Tax=Solanum dulcamara TaxID=45834 RepID=UPI002486A625|nr:uncharacterized protein LOC129884228 [Solanum dulcamara]
MEAIEKMIGYAKFMKDLITKKRTVSFESAGNLHHYCAIAIRSLMYKKEDPGAFTIPCTIGEFNFSKALCDLGASNNLMPLVVFRQLGLGAHKSTPMGILMAYRTVMFCALKGLESLNHALKRRELNLKNRATHL